jgi:hypothetical protein
VVFAFGDSASVRTASTISLRFLWEDAPRRKPWASLRNTLDLAENGACLVIGFQNPAGSVEGDPAEAESLDRIAGEHGVGPFSLERDKTAENAA